MIYLKLVLNIPVTGPTEELEQILSEFQSKVEETNKTVAEVKIKRSHDIVDQCLLKMCS